MSEVFSILLHNRQRYKQGKEGLWFSLPTTTEKLQAALREIGISADNPQDFFLYGYRSPQERPVKLPRDLVLSADVDELNFLAARLEKLDAAELAELNAALTSPQSDFHSIGQIIDYPDNVDYFGNLIDIRDSIVKYIQDLSDSNIILKQIYELVINSEDVIRKIIQGCLEGTYTLEPNKYDLRPDKLNELFEQGQDYIAGIKNIIKQMSEENNRKINILEIGGYSKSIVNNVSFELGSYIEKYTYLSPKNSEMGKVDNVAFEIECIDLDINNELFSYRCGKSKYDIVVAYQSIHCANNIDEAFKVIRKVLKSGGLLISVEPTRNSCFFNVVIGLLENNFNNYTDERSENEELLFDKQKWRESAIKAGLQEIATKNYGTMDKKVMFIWENKKELEEMFESEIKKILKKKLPNYMIPEFFVEMDVLPLSKNGKLDRKKVFSYLKECKFGRKDGTTATTYIEIEIVNILKDILKQNEVFMEDNFFQLGGDSLRAIKFKNSIQKRFNSNISIAQIFDSANIQEMVSKVEQSMLQNVEESIVVGDI